MTDKELLLLSWMAYLDLPPLYISILENGGTIPVRALADYTLRMDEAGRLECVKLNAASRDAAREMLQSRWTITGYINDNAGDGFVAYIVENDGTNVVAMRGSETLGECVASNVDWVDNVCEPFVGSVQLDMITAIAQRFSTGNIIFTGHSKGGHNALAALAVSTNPEATARAFNGQGFGAEALTDMQRRRLSERGVNYVVADDVVGALLEHPERRIFVQQTPGTNAHMPEAFSFDDMGNVIAARRTLRSRGIEIATRIAEKRLGNDAKNSVRAACRAALGAR